MKKQAQSEMVGFGLIIIIVAVLILVLVAISVNKTSTDFIKSKESANFLNSMLEYTTECESGYGNFLSMKKLMDSCEEGRTCLGGIDSCLLFNETMEELLEETWNVGVDWPVKGYLLNITYEGEFFRTYKKGNLTSETRGHLQTYDGGPEVLFIAYYS